MRLIGRIPGKIPRSDWIFPWPFNASLTLGSAAWRGIWMDLPAFGPASLTVVLKARKLVARLPIWKGRLKRCAISWCVCW